MADAEFECGARSDLTLRPTSGVVIVGYLHVRFEKGLDAPDWAAVILFSIGVQTAIRR